MPECQLHLFAAANPLAARLGNEFFQKMISRFLLTFTNAAPKETTPSESNTNSKAM
jgi:hypothetical protein